MPVSSIISFAVCAFYPRIQTQVLSCFKSAQEEPQPSPLHPPTARAQRREKGGYNNHQ